MDLEQTKQALRKFILENYLFTEDGAALNDDDSFLDSGILDSMGVLELIAFLDEDLSISVEGDEVVPDNLDSVNKVMAFIAKKAN